MQRFKYTKEKGLFGWVGEWGETDNGWMLSSKKGTIFLFALTICCQIQAPRGLR